jgi:hypothetical protein
MKYLLTLLFLLSTLAFGIDKKTPTGGTVKDKPGKSQSQISPDISVPGTSANLGVGGYTMSVRNTVSPGTGGTDATIFSISLKRGLYFVNSTVQAYGGSENRLLASIYIGGTRVTQSNNNNTVSSSKESTTHVLAPIVITTDDTIIEIKARCADTSCTGTNNELFLLKLRDL